MEPVRQTSRQAFPGELEYLKARLLAWAGWPRSASAAPSAGWSSATIASWTDVLEGDEPINRMHVEIDGIALPAARAPSADGRRTCA